MSPRALKTGCARGAWSALLGGPSALADMRFGGIKRFSIYAAISVSVLFAIYFGCLLARNLEPNEQLTQVYWWVTAIILATWLIADTRDLRRTEPTFDYGWFILFAFIVYVPYYLISTRGWRGVLMLAGSVLVLLLPFVLAVVAAAVYSALHVS